MCLLPTKFRVVMNLTQLKFQIKKSEMTPLDFPNKYLLSNV